MAQRGRRKPLVLTVRPLFEPTRLAPHCLVDAYERVVPARRRMARPARPTSDTTVADSTRQAGGIRG